jgi:hypothetical protein
MGNKKTIAKESNTTVALVVLCQDYILYDEELTNNTHLKKKLHDDELWLELSKHLYGKIKEHMERQRVVEGEYDEFEDIDIQEVEVLAFALNMDNRFELNDMILDTVENWVKFKGKK